jgi:DNA-binding LytR/AlgR family response regulator
VDETQASAHNSALNKRKTILIADDSAMVRTIIRQAIERDTDFVVCAEVADGTEAVTKAKELSPDLVILDVRMPGLNGMEVAGIPAIRTAETSYRSGNAVRRRPGQKLHIAFWYRRRACEGEWPHGIDGTPQKSAG